ncbi:MAG: malonyl-CoA decarboxylase family protein [Deltaproteobacteria bacterium]|nr:malonyl-CoA decarboxylase family protein [Deltaproteobacteria bacterium]
MVSTTGLTESRPSTGMMETKEKDSARQKSEKKVSEIIGLLEALGGDDSKGGEVFEQIKSLYSGLDLAEKKTLFCDMVKRIEVRGEDILPCVEKIVKSGTDNANFPDLLADLRECTASPRMKIFRKMAQLPGGLKFMLEFRGDLISVQRFSETSLRPLDTDLVLLFEMWFQEGFLYLEEITLDSAYRQIELIKNSDLVHPMTSIEEMGKRLGKDRRCFALYHRLLPYEPVIFIEVALTKGIVRKISDILESKEMEVDEGERDTAIFYSINNTQHGLTGLGMGKVLIGQVLDYLKKDQEQIKTFATISPLPGFWENYLKPILQGKDEHFSLKKKDLPTYFSKKEMARLIPYAEVEGDLKHEEQWLGETLLSILSGEEWVEDERLREALRKPLVRIAYDYITRERDSRGRPLNPVANFHMGNGATISQKHVNFLGNPSSKGLRESCGIMVNYIYSQNWLSQIRKSIRLLNRFEIKGIFTRG